MEKPDRTTVTISKKALKLLTGLCVLYSAKAKKRVSLADYLEIVLKERVE